MKDKLDNIKPPTEDQEIDTSNVRQIKSRISDVIGSHKELSHVGAKVSLSDLSTGASSGESFGSSSEMAVEGTGTIDQKLLLKVLSKGLPSFQECYEHALFEDSTLSGVVKLRWTISGSGTPSSPQIISSELHNAGLHACVIKVLLSLHFPSPQGGAVSVSYPLLFQSSHL